MKIAVDAMGGDFAPRNVVAGTAQALRDNPRVERLYLVGARDQIDAQLRQLGPVDPRLEIVHATEVIAMDDAPAQAVRRKKDSSMTRAIDLVKQGEADAVVSAGNTGALLAASQLKLRTLEGIDRPGLAAVLPAPAGPFVLIDAGANLEPHAANLVQYAVMGSLYAQLILRRPRPRIAVFSIGTEDLKGNELSLEVHRLLKQTSLNFVGNIDGHDLFDNRADVIITDAFVGNAVLKACESTARLISGWVRQAIRRNPVRLLGGLLAQGAFRELKRKADPDEYGGAVLLGINGICVKAHGASSPHAIKNAIRVAAEFVADEFNDHIRQEMRRIDEQTRPQPRPQSSVQTTS